jgi:enoyl-CoA hydratase/carnithine racemase
MQGGSWALPNRVGLARAMGLALTGDPLDATEACAMGVDLEKLPRRGINANSYRACS